MIISLVAIACVTVFIYMMSIYLTAQSIKNNAIVDIGWGPGFIIITLVMLLYTADYNLPNILTIAVISTWGFRLAAHIFARNAGKPEDFRYANWRKQWGKKQPWIAFYKIFMLQGFVMVIVALPIIFSFSSPSIQLSWINYAGLGLFLFGFLFESIGDYQMKRFKSDGKNKGKVLQSGLWKYTRHPNYFGEAVLWWGIYFLCFGSGYEFITLLSPVTISLLLRFGSGVPMLEEKYKDREDFREYASKTPVFIPFIGKKGL